jgi:hypothetical protein
VPVAAVGVSMARRRKALTVAGASGNSPTKIRLVHIRLISALLVVPKAIAISRIACSLLGPVHASVVPPEQESWNALSAPDRKIAWTEPNGQDHE